MNLIKHLLTRQKDLIFISSIQMKFNKKKTLIMKILFTNLSKKIINLNLTRIVPFSFLINLVSPGGAQW